MERIINYEIGSGRAFDEDGDSVSVQFCVAERQEETLENYVVVDGVLHSCWELSMFANLLSFWVRPATEGTTLVTEVCLDGTLTYQSVCDAFNRLAKLESEGHHGGQTFHTRETVWGMLTAMGVCIDLTEVDWLLDYCGMMLDGSFRELTVDELVGCLGIAAGGNR